MGPPPIGQQRPALPYRAHGVRTTARLCRAGVSPSREPATARGRVLVQRRSEPRLAGDASLRAGAALLPPSAESAARMGGGLRLVAVGGDHANPVLGAI